MKIAALDASTRSAGIALMEDGHLVYDASLNAGLTHSQTLMPLIEAAFEAAGWKPADIDVVGAVAGPGSFTGIRIGIAAAKGLAQAAHARTVAVGTLETLAMGAFGFGGITVPLLDARRSQVYTAAFRWEGDALVTLEEPQAADLDAWIAVLAEKYPEEKILLMGDGMEPYAGRVKAALGERVLTAPAHMVMQRAAACAELTRRMALEGKTEDPKTLVPMYVRSSSALTIEDRRRLKEGKA